MVEMKVWNEGSMYIYIYMDNGRKILELDGKCEMWYNMMMEMVEKEGKEWMWCMLGEWRVKEVEWKRVL